jgi:alpha-1,3/alpha-1,6-mannosyltransferase
MFYCHFPDLLLAQHTTILQRLYRKPIDMIEEATTGIDLGNSFVCLTIYISEHLLGVLIVAVILFLHTLGMADLILVNSKFTAGTFARTFSGLHARGIEPGVLYPAVPIEQFHEPHDYK